MTGQAATEGFSNSHRRTWSSVRLLWGELCVCEQVSYLHKASTTRFQTPPRYPSEYVQTRIHNRRSNKSPHNLPQVSQRIKAIQVFATVGVGWFSLAFISGWRNSELFDLKSGLYGQKSHLGSNSQVWNPELSSRTLELSVCCSCR